MSPRNKGILQENLKAWIFILPSFVFVFFFTLYPLVRNLKYSFLRKDLATKVPYFYGLENYNQMIHDPVFWKTLSNSLVFALWTVPLGIGLGLFLALLVNQKNKTTDKSLLRVLFFYPTVIPMIAAANIWMFIFTPSYGILDSFLSVLGRGDHNWLGDPHLVIPSLIVLFVWKHAGYLMIFLLAGMQNIGHDVYEAARLDGAGPIRTFFSLTLPLLMPTLLFVFVLTITSSFKLVDHLMIMTHGGPDNASNMLLYYIYEMAFSYWNIGRASALTIVLLVLLLLVVAVQFLISDRNIHYAS
ncbi:carbohydrate ABC transporter permease [Spirochaeta cellobiosiphila]|uniref:carbohydrate ABC transporter permease n=1 Tax=Spirochaeta cellobiosiphila TaxID=504483 RepID=UPI00040E20A9|nr:sugar ABC transporter permease [Spirochaeta cellobiosiphila]